MRHEARYPDERSASDLDDLIMELEQIEQIEELEALTVHIGGRQRPDYDA